MDKADRTSRCSLASPMSPTLGVGGPARGGLVSRIHILFDSVDGQRTWIHGVDHRHVSGTLRETIVGCVDNEIARNRHVAPVVRMIRDLR